MLSARNGSHNSKISQLVTRILEYPNIPRKRAKFEVRYIIYICNGSIIDWLEFCKEQHKC